MKASAMLSRARLAIAIATTTLLAALNPAAASASDFAFITTTDYITGNSATVGAQPPYTVDCPLRALHSDAVARYFEPYIYVLNRNGADNVQILDPASGFSTVRQFSVGAGSDPHDILVLGPTKAYVTRYNTNVIWIVDPSLGVQTGSIDLSSLADGDGLAEVDMMCRVGGRVFATVQRLDRNAFWVPAGTSYVAVIDAVADTLVDANPAAPGVQPIVLTGADPYSDIQLEPYTGKLYVSCVGYWGVRDGGVETIDPATLQPGGFLLTETAVQGDVIDVEIDMGTKGFAIVMDDAFQTLLVSFDAETGLKTKTLYDPDDYVLQDIELSPWKELFLADRTPTQPGIRIYDVFSGSEVTTAPIDVCLPPFDITFSLPVQTGIEDPPAVGRQASLGRPFPNPFNPAATIPFTLESPARVRLTIYDALGRRVRTLIDGERPAGAQAATWDGRDGRGRAVPSGVYFVELDAEGVVESGKVIVAR